MCTVVVRLQPSEPARILAVRDEFVSRTFDDPGAWWPGEPDVIGGRDRLAGGTWCATDVAAGRTALVLNRRERQTGKPSRGVLPLTALQHGTEWPAHLDHRDMASFTLVLADHDTVTAWTWDAVELRRVDLAPGTHVFTARGIDPDDRKTARYARRFAGSEDWRDLVTAEAAARRRVGVAGPAPVRDRHVRHRPGSAHHRDAGRSAGDLLPNTMAGAGLERRVVVDRRAQNVQRPITNDAVKIVIRVIEHALMIRPTV